MNVLNNETNNFQNLTDENIALLAQEGNENATSYLLYKYKNMVKGFSRRFFIMGADSEDLVQEGMIGLFKAIQKFEEAKYSAFSTFAYQCVKNQIQDAVKSANRKKHSALNNSISLNYTIKQENDETDEILDFLSCDEFNPETKILKKESSKSFYKKLQSLFSKKELLILSNFLQGKTYEEIANTTNVTKKKVDNTLTKIRKILTKSFLEAK